MLTSPIDKRQNVVFTVSRKTHFGRNTPSRKRRPYGNLTISLGRVIHILSPAEAREYDRTKALICSNHTHCTPAEAEHKVNEQTHIRISKRILCIYSQAVCDNRPWQNASGWVPKPSGPYIVMQLITDKSYRLT